MSGLFSSPPRVPPSAVIDWRERVTRFFPDLTDEGSTNSALPSVEKSLRDLAEALHTIHGTPHLGNRLDPTEELVYIVLSRKTAERAYRPAFDRLRALGTWDEILGLPIGTITSAIQGCGLERKKALAISEGLRTIAEKFGEPDLAAARDLPDEDLFSFLNSLPEIGPKSALCIMLFAFSRPVFPVDAHVGRVLARLGIFEQLGLDLTPMDHRRRQRVLLHVVPPDLRYGLHVNLVQHGRKICTASRPACSLCPFAGECRHVEQDYSERQMQRTRRP